MPGAIHVQRAIEGGGALALSNEQKRELVRLARSAWRRHGSATGMPFDDWRREEAARACGKGSLRCATQRDYLAIRAHYRLLAGDARGAFRDALADQSHDRRVALAKLAQECRRAADVLPEARAYAEGFLRNKRGLEPEDAPEADLWHAVFVVRRRAAQLRRGARR